MRLTVLGASGGTGTQVVRQALESGHQVTAVVRDPARLDVSPHDGLDVVAADLADVAAIEPLVKDRDAVISALGSRDRGPTTVCTDGARSTIAAMTATGGGRLLVVSASGFHTAGDGIVPRAVVKPLLKRLLRHPFADMARMEELLRESGLRWTIVRPPQLTDGPRTGAVRSRIDANVRGSFRISRADLADFLLRAAGDESLAGVAVSVARA
ncbi:NAD(P)-dependent oxidoreductase [Qaidamihabitans albus]|uniref:NAD(P)-dependent oxidoreductase n=1 Tax=Qaidamihabitans albus TaxID=2795733 RepID=UPI0018F22907|nr:NAD(P)H-binding protein [Qaidamihabitans albus]